MLSLQAAPRFLRRGSIRSGAVIAAWSAVVATTWALDGRVDLGSQALPLVLGAAAMGLWLPWWAAVAVCIAATLGFNWFFVPPRGSLDVGLRQHLLLLSAMLAVSLGVTWLVARQRRLAEREALNARRVAELLELGDRLRGADGIVELHRALQDALDRLGFGSMSMLLRDEQGLDGNATAGALTADEQAGLRLCAQQGTPFGPGTGRYEHQGCWYLPMRGRASTVGAVLLRPGPQELLDATGRVHAQALCDQVGLVAERSLALREAETEARLARDQTLRSTILAAVSHDYRTPLAAIMGAASALRDQAERMSVAQRTRLADSIIDEVTQLGRLTDNALQLVRLDSPGIRLRLDWESAEELVGSVLGRVRQRDPQRRLKARVEPELPLLRCDAVLVVQLLENLIDNALKYTPAEAPVEVLVRRLGSEVLIAVRDRGPGIPPAWRQRVFEVFQRVEPGAAANDPPPADAGRPRGAGVGLAVCRAIAQAHGGTLAVRARGHGGSSFEFRLPIGADAAPAVPTIDPAESSSS